MADTQTSKLNLTLPEVGVSETWANSINNNFTTLDNSVTLTTTQTVTNKTFTDCVANTQSASDNSTKIATTAYVTNAVSSTGGSLDSLSDTTISSVADNDLIAYDSSTSKYINQSATEAGLQPAISSSSRLNADLIGDGTVSSTEFGYLNGASSNLQNQINNISGSNVTEDTVVALSLALG